MRPARKSDTDPPRRVIEFIQSLISTPLEEIEAPLSRFTWDYDDKGSLHHWTELFVHFNLFLSKYVSSRNDLQLSDNMLDEETPFPKGAVMQILRVLTIIFENCRDKGSFSGLEHFTHLLASNDPEILLAALQALVALVKINPAKLHLSGRLPASAVLNRHLLALSQGWGTKEEGLGLFSCVVENGCDSSASQLGSTLHFEFYKDNAMDTAENTSGQNMAGLQVVHVPGLLLQPKDSINLLKDLVHKHQIPSELRFTIWTRIRYACAFSSITSRRQYTCIRLLAFMVLVQSTDTHEELGAFFSNDPEFMNELMKVLQSEDLIPDNIRALAMWALSYQFAAISASQERSRVLNVPNIASNAANRVFLLSLLQKAVMSLTTTEACPISLVEGALYFFLAHVTSSSASPSPTRETGLIPALLPLLEDINPTHMHLVVCGVKILRKFMDYSSPAVTLFRDLRGLDNSIRRLQIEVNRVVEVPQGSDIATSSCNELRHEGQILYCRRRLIKALLKVLGLTTYAPGTTARAPNSEESSLPSSLSLIFRHSHKFGGDIFSSGVTLMNELIHKDPTCFPMLHAAGLPTAFLDTISEDLLLPSSKALCCIPNGLDALCLNNVGLQAVTETNALQFLVGVFTSRKYLLALHEGVAPLANAMEELMRHVPSLRGPGVDVIIEILRRIATMDIVGLESKETKDCPVPMETDFEDKHNAGVAVTGTAAQDMTNERFLQSCISHAMVFVHRALETSDICRIFVEKKGIEALMSFLTLPGIPLSSDGMTVAVHMVAVSKVFTHQHSNALAQVYCECLRGHLRATIDELDPVAGTNLLAAENGLNQKVFWCLFVLQFFVFLADATRENRWLAALMTEFGNGGRDVLLDIGRIHREILWQIALFEDSKVGMKKDDGPSVKALTTDSDAPASDIDEPMPSSIGQYVDLILNQHRQSTVWNAEHQLFDLIHLFHDFGHRARLQRRLNMDSSRSRQISSRQISSHSDEGTSRSKTESSKPKSLHSFCYEILRSLSFHISHLFSEMGKVMHLPSRRRDDSSTVGPASKNVASTFAKIFLDDLNFAGHNNQQTEIPISAKCSYLGKVVDFIQAVIVDRQESCNPVLLNSFYAHGVIKVLLTTFEATGQLLWTVMQTPSMMETEGKELEHKDESEKAWIFSTLVTYAGLMDHLVRPTSILASNSSHFLVQPVAGGEFSLPKDAENFAKVLQSQILKAVRPLWNHPLFPQCSVEFISLICSIMKHVYTGVDAKMVKATGNVGNASFQGVAPPLDESAIAMIVEMGFSRSRAEEALRHVRSNRVELAMEWLISHPEEASQEDDELARALALSLGSTDSSATEEMATDQKVMEDEEDLLQSPPIDEILSTCVKLLQAKDSLAFPLRDLLVILCTRNDGQDRGRVISFLVDQLKLCNGSEGSHNSLLSLTSHVLALILHEDNVACQVASENGLVSVLLDVLSNFCPAEVEMEKMPELKYVTAILLVLGHMVQAKPKSDSNVLTADQLKKRDESHQNAENVGDNQQKSLEHALSVGEGYMTAEEQKRGIDIVCNFIHIHFPSTTIQALLQLCARLTRVHAIASRFLEKGGLAALLNLPTKCLFSGFDNVATTIIRHILEDPHTLQLAMESEIRHSIVAASTRNIGGRVSPRTFLSNLSPVISRDPAVFILAARAVCQIEMHGERPYVILSKDREKEKGKEKEKLLEKDKQVTGDKAIQVEKSLPGNLSNGSIKIFDVGGKTKGHKRSSHNFASVIEQLLDVIIQFSPAAKDDVGGKSQCSGSATDMEVDENPLDGKGKAVVGKDNVELECKSSAALARAAFILKLLTEILLMYPSAINVVLRRDTESGHLKGPLQGGATVMGHGGPLHHVLNRLLPYSGYHSKEKQPNIEWGQKLSNKASQFLMAVCVRSGEGRRRVFMEIVNFLNAYLDNHDGGYKPPDSQMNAFIDFINDVLAARSPSGSNISAEVSKTLIDVGAVNALCLTLQFLDLDHPDSVKIVNGIVKALESLTVEQIQSQEDSENKQGSRGASDSNHHQLSNDGENQVGPSSDTIAQPRQNESDFDQMESSHDALVHIRSAANLIMGSEEDFTHESVEEDGVVADYSMDNGGQDSSADEDEEEEMSGDGGEDVEDDDEDEEEDDEELDEDDVHHLSHPDADQDDQDVHELGDDFDEDADDLLEDEEDDDDENNFIFRLEDGIDMFNHFELGREGDFPSDPFHVMPIEEVFGANRRQGRTTSIYNLLGRTDDRGAAFQHPLLVPSIPSRSVLHRPTENPGDRLITERNLESTSAQSDLDSIFRTLRSGRPGNRLSNWADDSQQLRGTNSSSIALGIEELFVSQLRRVTPVEDGPTTQGNDVNVSHGKGEASVAQAADDGTPTVQQQEDDIIREEQVQSQTEGNIGGITSTEAAQPLQCSSEIQGNQSAISGQHDLDVQDERNERSMRDVEAVSQDSSGSGATLGESLRSLEVEIGSADGHDDTGERPPLGDSQTTRIQALGRVLGAAGNLNQLNTSGNMEGVQVENTNRDPVQPDNVRDMNQTVTDGASTEQQQTNMAAGPNSIDPAFLEALPEDLRTEVLASQQNQPAQTVNSDPPNTDEIDPEFLAALPPDIQAEVLAQQRAQRLLQSRQFEGQPVDMDSASILATLPPDLRAEVLLTSPEGVLANISESLVTEARRLRQRFGYYLPTDRLGAARRTLIDRSRRNGSGIGGRNGSMGSDRVGSSSSHKAIFGDKLIESDGKPLVDAQALKAMLRLLRLVQPVYKGSLQRLLFNICTHSVTRVTLVQLLLDMLLPDVEGFAGNSDSDGMSSYRLYGCLGHVNYSRPQLLDGVPPLVSRRVLETLTHLAQNHPLVAKHLLYLEENKSHRPKRDHDMDRGKALMIDEENRLETINEEDSGKFPIVLLLKLLNQPLYSRSTAHLEQVMGLLKVIMQSIEIDAQSGSESQPSDLVQKSAPPDGTTDEHLGSSRLEMASHGSSSGAGKKFDAKTILLGIPKTELRLLSSLLAREGLTELAYSHSMDVLMKLVKIVPSHRHLFISELASATETLSKIAVSELQSFGEGETIVLSMTLSGAAILRVLQALSSLAASFQKEKDDEILPEQEHAESLVTVRSLNAGLEPLWQELSLCISKIENRSSSLSLVPSASGNNGVLPPLPPGTQRVLPYIEAFFVTCEKLQSGQTTSGQLECISATATEVKEATSLFESTQSLCSTSQQRKNDEKGITLMKFAEKHKRLLNAFVRQNSGLLEKSLSLLLKVPRLIEFDNKRAYFRSKIRQHQDHQNYSSVRISVRRAYVLEDSYNQLRMRQARELKGRLNVHFQGEEGIDAGGLTREWYQLLSRVIFDKNALLFTTVGNEATFQPNPNSCYQTEHLSYFKFVGRVVAKALFDGQLLDVHFTRSFYKHILGAKVTYHDIEAVDPDYYKNLKWMLENDIRDMPDLTFSMDADEEKLILYEKEEVTDHELIPGGRNIRVTEENKHEYVDLVAEHRLTTAIRPQINAFLEGFNELVPRNLISIFNDKELELLISGLPEIDLDDLRANTEYAGYSAASPVIQWFWEVVQSFNKEDRARLIQFVTGTSKVPLEGFKALQGISGLQRFQIHKAYGSPDRLPSAHTCFNQLDLPEYPSREQLEERLLLAIHEANEGFGFG